MLNLRLGGEAAGWELVHELRTDHQLIRIPVIICTTDLHRVLAGVTGMASIDGVHLLAKPFSLIELEAAIARVVPPAALSTGTAAPDIAASRLVVGSANVGQPVHPEVADA